MKIDPQTTEYRNVFSENPVLFMCDLEQAIKDGFRVVDCIAGYPLLQGMLKEVRVFRGDGIVAQANLSLETEYLCIENYKPMDFLLEAQAAMLAGYVVDTHAGISSTRFGSPHRVTLKRSETAEDAIIEEVLKEFPPIDVEPDDVVDSVHAAAEAAPKRRGRRPRSA